MQKINTLIVERKTVINQKLKYQTDNRKLAVDINNIQNVLAFLDNLNW
ncbi:hypothetical protein [Spiroplasma endosymbiont of Polydrusus formosus]